MTMTLDEAIQHCEEVAKEQESHGYCDRSLCVIMNVNNATCDECEAVKCRECASEHRQLAEWLKELKAYRDARAEIAEAFNDDARGEQNDYERGRKSGIFLCESIISVKLGESRSEIPNTCEDAISRQAVLDLIEHYNSDGLGSVFYGYEEGVKFAGAVNKLPSVTPQQRTGRWIQKEEEGEAEPFIIWECSECHCVDEDGKPSYKYCPQCGAKMEVEEGMSEALDMAIKALEQERSRSAEITQYRHDCEKLMEENGRLKKALEQEPCDDVCEWFEQYVDIATAIVELRFSDGTVKRAKRGLYMRDIEKSIRKMLIDQIANEKKQEPKWIPVSERLPEDETYVLTTIKVPNRIAHARSGWYKSGFFHNDNGDTWRATDMEVIAWMPLPEPYKSEREVQE